MIKVTVKKRKRRCNKLRRLQLHDVIVIEKKVDSIIGFERQWSSSRARPRVQQQLSFTKTAYARLHCTIRAAARDIKMLIKD